MAVSLVSRPAKAGPTRTSIAATIAKRSLSALRVLTQRQLRLASSMKGKTAQRRLLASLVNKAQARLDLANNEQQCWRKT